jgi:colanic acid/amylovoran biosynthesis protein
MLPQSIGPIKGQLQSYLARQVFDRVALIMHRDRLSLSFVTRNLRLRTPGILVPDLAFGLPPTVLSSSKRTDLIQIGVNITDRIAQRDSVRQEIYENVLETVLVKLNRAYNAHLHIFVQCYGPSLVHDDRLAAQRLYVRLQCYTDKVNLRERFYDVMSLRNAYAQMDCVIGTRMHTAIFAASSGVPIVLIGYQSKAFGLMDMLGVSEYSCDIETLTAKQLFEVTSRALQNREEIRQHLIARYNELRAQLDGWTDYLEIK